MLIRTPRNIISWIQCKVLLYIHGSDQKGILNKIPTQLPYQ